MDTKPTVKLVGEDGNVFAIIGKVSKALRRECSAEVAKEYSAKVMSCGSYNEALQITMEYVTVT